MQKVRSESTEEWRQSAQESVYEWYDQDIHDRKRLNARPDQPIRNALFCVYLTHYSMYSLRTFCIICSLTSSIYSYPPISSASSLCWAMFGLLPFLDYLV
jgi:hypothetical protein